MSRYEIQDPAVADPSVRPPEGTDMTPLPDGALVRLQSISMGESCRPNFRCILYEDGRYYMAQNQGDDCPAGKAFDTDYPSTPTRVVGAEGMSRMRAVIADRMPLLAAGYRSEGGTDDGSVKVLDAREGGRARRVVADREWPAALDEIISTLWDVVRP